MRKGVSTVAIFARDTVSTTALQTNPHVSEMSDHLAHAYIDSRPESFDHPDYFL